MFAEYLDKYAEEDVRTSPVPKGRWDSAVVLPLYQEADLLEGCLESLAAAAAWSNKAVLLLAVVNTRSSSPPDVHTAEILKRPRHGLTQVIVEKTFSEKQGVGLARKLGSDLAIQVLAEGHLKESYIHTTDADARVEEDYFEAVHSVGPRTGLGMGLAALVHPYFHALDWKKPQSALALSLYDAYLDYYAQGLKYAQSPYAFPTLGSTITFQANAYCTVRGFPKLLAAEDFYILSKLAQVGQVAQASRGAVTLVQRESDRVPFGTGRAMQEMEKLKLPDGYRVYDPRAFTQLQYFLMSLRRFGEHRQLLSVEAYWKAQGLEKVAAHFGVSTALEQALRTRKDTQSLLRHCFTWFDALKTVQFFHYLAEKEFPNVPILEALKKAPFRSRQPRLTPRN